MPRRWLRVAALAMATSAAAAPPATPRLGHAVARDEAARVSLHIFPDGRGLPPGRGTAAEGAPLFAQRCAACHGEGGLGASAQELAGGTSPLTSPTADQTIGLYWPYATTVFDFTRRAMPLNAPGSLTNDEVYALTAWMLFANGLIGERDEMNARTLPAVRMPNRQGFVGIDAPTR